MDDGRESEGGGGGELMVVVADGRGEGDDFKEVERSGVVDEKKQESSDDQGRRGLVMGQI